MKAKPRRTPKTLEIIIGVSAFALALFGLSALLNTDRSADETCAQTGKTHAIQLQHDSFSSSQLTARQCDTITVTNRDDQAYLLAFGNHAKHQDYPGFTEQTVTAGKQLTITLVEAGNFRLHDHYRDDAVLDIHIKPQ